MNELIIPDKINPATLFAGEDLDPLLAKIAKEVRSFVPDTSTKKGRDAIASLAHKVAQSKTFLDGKGKDLTADWKARSKIVDAERKKLREFLDALKAEARKPLTDFEDAAIARISRYRDCIKIILDRGTSSLDKWDTIPLENLRARLAGTEAEPMGNHWGEFAGQAAEANDTAIASIKLAIQKRQAADAAQAELEKLRAQEAGRLKLAEENRIRMEAVERERVVAAAGQARAARDRQDAEARAKKADEDRIAAEKAAEERAEQATKDAAALALETERQMAAAAERYEQQKIEDAKLAKDQAELATLRERERAEDEKKAEEAATMEREANKKHKESIHRAAATALVAAGLSDAAAKAAVHAISNGDIPSVTILY